MGSILPTSAANIGEFTPRAAPGVPPLENGDHLKRAAFLIKEVDPAQGSGKRGDPFCATFVR